MLCSRENVNENGKFLNQATVSFCPYILLTPYFRILYDFQLNLSNEKDFEPRKIKFLLFPAGKTRRCALSHKARIGSAFTNAWFLQQTHIKLLRYTRPESKVGLSNVCSTISRLLTQTCIRRLRIIDTQNK